MRGGPRFVAVDVCPGWHMEMFWYCTVNERRNFIVLRLHEYKY